MKIIETIINQWEGYCIAFPVVRNRGDDTFIYMKDTKPRAIIATYKADEKWSLLPDFQLCQNEFKDILTMCNIFDVPVIIAAEYVDRQVFAKAETFYVSRKTLIHEGRAYLPKDERFQLLTKS